MTHTPGPWVDSPNTSDAIISKRPDAIEQAGQALGYYGGYVICESVTPRDKPLIKAAPEMFKALEKLVRRFELVRSHSDAWVTIYEFMSEEIIEIERVLSKIKGDE